MICDAFKGSEKFCAECGYRSRYHESPLREAINLAAEEKAIAAGKSKTRGGLRLVPGGKR